MSKAQIPTKVAQPVIVSIKDLESGTVSFETLLAAFGPESLGILVVKDLPAHFASLRQRVLSNSSLLAALSSSSLAKLTNPTAKYLVGWSHGVETLKPGVFDTAKGSYYINCAFYKDAQLAGADGDKFPGFEEYTAPNVWPDDADVPGFRSAAESLISLIIDTAVLVARACDRFAASEVPGYTARYLEEMVRSSTTTKARLLHYFPTTTSGAGASEDPDSWCATHLDHGCLTGLTSAMFVDETASGPLEELPSSPSPSAGLYIQSRSGEVYKVSIPRDCLAFQTGEALQRLTEGRFKAVPHFVRGVEPGEVDKDRRIARNTLAVFTQPDLDAVIDLQDGLTFGEFARGVVHKNTRVDR